LYFFWM